MDLDLHSHIPHLPISTPSFLLASRAAEAPRMTLLAPALVNGQNRQR